MRRAIELAKQGEGWTSPNPLVGKLISKKDDVVTKLESRVVEDTFVNSFR